MMEADEILTSLNKAQYPIFEWMTFVKLGFVYTRGVWPVFAIMFIGADPGFTCNSDGRNKSFIPLEDGCDVLVNYEGHNITEKCQDFTYGDSFTSTIVTEFNLVCGREYMVELSTTIYMIGNALGAALISPLSDRYGRKWVMLLCLWLQGAFGISVIFVQNYGTFLVLRFFVGFLNMAIALTTYVMVVELFSAKHRTGYSVGLNLFWATGIISLALFGFLIRDWRYLQLVLTLPNFITVLYIWFLPESIPWLVLKGEWKKLDKLLISTVGMNNVTLSTHLLQTQAPSTASENKSGTSNTTVDIGTAPASDIQNATYEENNSTPVTPNSEKSAQQIDSSCITSQVKLQRYGSVYQVPGLDELDHKHDSCSLLDLFRSPNIRKYTIVLFYLWFVNSLSYFGILFSTPTLHGDMFVNLAISGAVEIPACFCTMFVLQRTGRKKPLICFMLLCGVMNIITIFIPSETGSGTSLHWLIITLAMIGKFGITGAYSTVYLISAEIFPTGIRNQAVGLSSFFENCGSITAPFIVFWARNMTSLPFVVFGSLVLLGGMLAFLLPETHDQALPDTATSLENEVAMATKDVAESQEPIVATRL